jgi:hypothetical protein
MSTPFYDLASLVVVPSGYKASKVYAQKPLTTDGQLTFTRASNATRVASNGLIEKVRTNLILQSNTFNTTWTKTGYVLTSGQAGYDGTNNAWLVECTSAGQALFQALSVSGINTLSFYVKKNSASYVRLRADQVTDSLATFNLNTGAVSSTSNAISAKITSLGNDWYRCSLTWLVDTLANVQIRAEDAGGSPITGTFYIQDAQLEAGDIATDYIATTTAAVSVGPVSGLPRLDYLNSSCPRLLLEPQRTNLFPYYSYLSGWSVNSVTLTNNYATSPEGLQNATRLTRVTTGNIGQNVAITSGTNYAISIFGKADTGSIVNITTTGDFPSSTIEFDLSDQSTSVTLGSFVSYGIESYGNGWYRCWVVQAPTTTGTGTIRINTGDNMSVLLYGAQCEAGSYITSIIPTNGTSVTRVADAASKTGISSLIGQTEGTLYWEGDLLDYTNTDLSRLISLGALNDRIVLLLGTDARPRIFVNVGGSIQASATASVSMVSGKNKVAFAYKQNDFIVYLNGVSVLTDTSGNVPTCSDLFVGTSEILTTADVLKGGVSQALVFKTRLTNAQLAELTTL